VRWGETVKVLAIETSCDETAAAVVEDGRRVLSSVVSSQTDIHADFGGVVPEIASRAHLELFAPVVAQALSRAATAPAELSAVAATIGPGLIGSLLVGVSAAKAYAWAWGVSLRRCQPYGRPSPGRLPGRPGPVVAHGGPAGFGRSHHAYLHAGRFARRVPPARPAIDDAAGEALRQGRPFPGPGLPGRPGHREAGPERVA